MVFLNKQLHFVSSVKKKIGVGFILCLFLDFIIIFLEPFGTDQFDADNRLLLLSGFGVMAFLVFVIQSSIENIWYYRMGKVWLVRHEIVSTVIFGVFSGSAIYWYNAVIVNGVNCTAAMYWRYLGSTVIYMTPVFFPAMLYLRQKFGECIVPLPPHSIVLSGENKNEVLRLEKERLLFVRAVENYVEICFVDQNKKAISKTFRQTLSKICEQAPFLEKCHRSYLVNLGALKEINGNSQSAKIIFAVGDKEIPLSKTYYRDIKNKAI